MSTDQQSLSGRVRERWVLALTALASLMVALDALVVTTALSTMRVELHASIEALEWTMNAYSLSFAVLLMTAAVLGDRFGRRRVFSVGLALFIAASAACALAPGIGWLVAARAVQGAGGSLVMPMALALLSAAFPPERRGRALGVFSGVTGLAVLGGPLVGGAITEGLSWEWIFWLNIPIGLLLIPLVRMRIGESFGPRTRPDLGGLALITFGALGLVWGLVRGNQAGWGSLEVLGALVGGALSTVAFVAWESRAREPMLPLRLFRTTAFSAGNAASFLLSGAITGAAFFMAQFLQAGLHYGPVATGLRLLPWTATLFLVAPVAGALADRFGERPLIASGLVLQAAGMGWIALIAEPGLSYPAMVFPLVIAGCGVSMAMPSAQNAVIGAVARTAIGKASGTFTMSRQLGGVFGIALGVAAFAATGGYLSPREFSDGFAPAMGICAALSVLGAVAGLGTRRGRRDAVVPLTPAASAAPATSSAPAPAMEARVAS